MEKGIRKEDLEFLKWLDSKECEHYWVKDEKGEKGILKDSWTKAMEEYSRIKKLYDNKTFFYSQEVWT